MKTDFTLANMRKWDLIRIIRELEKEIDILKFELKNIKQEKTTYTKYKIVLEENERLRRALNEQ